MDCRCFIRMQGVDPVQQTFLNRYVFYIIYWAPRHCTQQLAPSNGNNSGLLIVRFSNSTTETSYLQGYKCSTYLPPSSECVQIGDLSKAYFKLHKTFSTSLDQEKYTVSMSLNCGSPCQLPMLTVLSDLHQWLMYPTS